MIEAQSERAMPMIETYKKSEPMALIEADTMSEPRMMIEALR